MAERNYSTSLFIFRRDLRLEDNTALMEANRLSETVIPLFIFDPRQADPEKNEYFSENAFQFLVESLEDLDEKLRNRGSKLYILEDRADEALEKILKEKKIDALFVNRDYTPFSRKRDKQLKKICDKHEVEFLSYEDLVLSPFDKVMTGEGKPYTVFTPFMKRAKEFPVQKPSANKYDNFYSGTLKGTQKLSDYKRYDNPDILQHGGRDNALEILRNFDILGDYEDTRNIPSIKGTSRLSPHHKFGTISIRETYWHVRDTKPSATQFISELYWRDFFTYVAWHMPDVFEKSYQERGNKLAWRNDKKEFKAWCEGKTGIPMVDAGMRELNTVGWMHNRVRMVVAAFLTKDLLIDWHWGEKYFATRLVDYDPCVNNGSWQWSASVGVDPKPLRIFNPYTQAKKFDPDALYIKKWVPELKDVETKLLTKGDEIDYSEYADYPAPIVSHNEAYHRAMDEYKKAKAKVK